jgi:hypothetical protein
MPTQPSHDSTSYRQVVYTGGRILQADELNLVQSITKDPLGDIFDDGALLNAKVAIAGNTASLAVVDPANPVMKVFVNGGFEIIKSGALTPVILPSGPVEGTLAAVYANFILWKVTSDGANNTIADPSLVDSAIAEPGADRGQIQVYVGADDHQALATNMLARNTAPIVVAALQWHSGAWAVTLTGPKNQMLASPAKSGMVVVTGSSTVASTDDSRLADQRVPTDGSVNTAKLAPTAAAVPPTGSVGLVDDTGVNVPLTINTISGGVDAGSVRYPTWGASVSASIALIWSQIVRIFAQIKSIKDTVAGLSAAAGSSTVGAQLLAHIGHNIGAAPTHPGVSDGGFQANGAIQVLSGKDVAGELDAAGNYHLHGNDVAVTTTTHNFIKLDNFLTLAGCVKTLIDAPVGVPSTLDGDVSGGATSTLIQKIKGKSIGSLPGGATPHAGKQMVVLNGDNYELADIPVSGAGAVTLAGDVTGASGACTVVKLQGKAVASAAPTEGQVLKSIGGVWTPATDAGTPSISQGDAHGTGALDVPAYLILTFGKVRIAFGTVQAQNGQNIPVPTADWNGTGTWGYTTFNIALVTASINDGWTYHVWMSGNTVMIDPFKNGAAAAEKANIQAGMFASIQIVTISQD